MERLEEIKILLSFEAFNKIILHQIYVKSTFLNCYLNEVYVQQPHIFEDNEFLYYVFNQKRSLYGLNKLQGLDMID